MHVFVKVTKDLRVIQVLLGDLLSFKKSLPKYTFLDFQVTIGMHYISASASAFAFSSYFVTF